MNPPIENTDLPTPEETIAYIHRERPPAEGGPNWAAVSAAFVCPGAGQFLVGQKASGIAFFAMFIIAVLISFIPLGLQLLQGIRHAFGMTNIPPDPMPWFFIVGGISLALIVWIAAMIHAACLGQTTD